MTTAWPMVRAWIEGRAEFTFSDAPFVAVQINTGRVEIYRVDNDGLEIFQGYADAPREYALPAPLVVAALGALVGPGRERVKPPLFFRGW